MTGVGGLAVRADGPELASIAETARERDTALIVGLPERVERGTANSAVCLDRHGDVVAVYRKAQLYRQENDAFVVGDALVVAELRGLKIGLMICFDVEFPEVARSLARAGADLLVTISANMEPFGNDHAVFVSARALENGLPHAYVNQVGSGDNDLVFTGGSRVVSPDGRIPARADSTEESVVYTMLQFPLKSKEGEDNLTQLRSPLPKVEILSSHTEPGPRD